MIFGVANRFAIELGEIESWDGVPYCQFQFWVCGLAVGDWEDRIPLRASIENMRIFCEYSTSRFDPRFHRAKAEEIVEAVYDGFFNADYTTSPVSSPNLRDRFHLDEVAMSSVIDKHGIILINTSQSDARMIVKNLKNNAIERDCDLHVGEAEQIGKLYIGWGEKILGVYR